MKTGVSSKCTAQLNTAVQDLAQHLPTEHGLPEAFKIRLEQVTNQADLMVVAGYSGTDHFDINHWIRDRWNGKRSTRLVWIDHRPSVEEEFWRLKEHENREPRVYWQYAFGGMKIQHGPTLALLSSLLGTLVKRLKIPKRMATGGVRPQIITPLPRKKSTLPALVWPALSVLAN